MLNFTDTNWGKGVIINALDGLIGTNISINNKIYKLGTTPVCISRDEPDREVKRGMI